MGPDQRSTPPRPRPSRGTTDVLRGASALVCLAVLMVGVPLGLIALVGWPLPSALPSGHEVADAITRVGISDRTIVKIVACVLWVAWLQLAVSVVAEIAGAFRRRTVRGVPALGLFRQLAGSLLASVMLLLASAHGAEAGPPARPAALATVPFKVGPVVLEAEATPPEPPAAVERTWSVRPRDTLWGIAEQTLGRGERWVDIRSANVGRAVAPGVMFTEHTEVLLPGWTLALPADARAVPPPPPEASPTVTVVKGDSLSRIAERTYGDAGRWRDLWEANRDRDFGGRQFVDPNLILPGWQLVVPVTAALAPPVPVAEVPAPEGSLPPPDASTPPPSPEPAPTPEPSSSASAPFAVHRSPFPSPAVEDVAVPEPPAGDLERPGWVLPAGITGATLLATGAAGLLASRRRRRLRRMGRDEAMPLPDPDLAPTEAAVRLGDDPAGMARVDVALRNLAARLGRATDGSVPRPEALLRQATGDIEVILDRAAPDVPSPWCRTSRPDRLLLPAGIPTEVLVGDAARLPAPCPAMVMLGTSADAELYVDFEALGVITVDGPPAMAAAIARALVATLAVSPLADLVHVVTAGVDCYGFAHEERVHSVSDPDAALDLSAALSAGVRRALTDGEGTHILRREAPQEPWEPVVAILLRGDLSPEQLADVRRLVDSGGVAVVTDAEVPGARYRLRAGTDGTWQLEPTGIAVTPRGLAANELADLGALLADAKAPPVRLEPHPPQRLVDAPFVEPPWLLMVRLLGPVEVVNRSGTPASFERAKALELVAWLAQHRANPTRTGARTAMWETDVRDATFANVVSDARRALMAMAAPPDGEEWLGRTYGEQLPLHPLVVTDADLLAARVEHARRQDHHAAVATLREALAGVHDAPYVGTAWMWPDGEALPSHLTLLVTNAATEMAERCLVLGDADGVFWATAQGMKVLPGHDELVCLRMQAHAAAGNLAGVRKEFESYERVVTSDPWSDGEPSAKVVQLRNRVLAPSRQPS